MGAILNAHLRDRGISEECGALAASCLAHGAILVSAWDSLTGVAFEVGLAEHLGRPARDGWKAVLRGKFQTLVVPERERTYDHLPIRVYQMGAGSQGTN